MKKIQNTLLKLILCSCFVTVLQAEFIDNGDNTVTDTINGLQWQKSINNTTSDFPKAVTYCNNLVLGGKDDWRVSNIHELYTLLNTSATSAPLTYSVFSNIKNSGYWSSTISYNSNSFNLVLYFQDGKSDRIENTSSSQTYAQLDVICVRGGIN